MDRAIDQLHRETAKLGRKNQDLRSEGANHRDHEHEQDYE
jgi:hypothetical protein